MVDRYGRQKTTISPDFQSVIENNMQVSANDAVFRDNGFFKAGSLSGKDAQKFWEDENLRGHKQKDREKTLRWLREGVRIEDFLRGNLKGKFKGQPYDSLYPDEQSFENLVKYKHQDVGRQGDK